MTKLTWTASASFPGLPSLGTSATLNSGAVVSVLRDPNTRRVEVVLFRQNAEPLLLWSDAGSLANGRQLVASKISDIEAL